MRFKRFEEMIAESINDSHLFKAVFIVGGPGSGKTYLARKLFGNIKHINADAPLEMILRREGMSMAFDPAAPEYGSQQAVRDRAKKVAAEQLRHATDGMLPLVIDGTGKDLAKIRSVRARLEGAGYDCYMVFVNAPLETALSRNRGRDRSLSDDLVRTFWQHTQDNLHNFADEFGQDRFFVVDSDSADQRIPSRILGSPLQNRTGRERLAALRAGGGRYLHDLG